MIAPHDMPRLYESVLSSPLGALYLTASARGLRSIRFAQEVATGGDPKDAHPFLQRAQQQLAEYFAGRRKHFDVPLDLQGTVFQIKAWRALQAIPYGQTRSYSAQAAWMGDARKARAVGRANHVNPLPIVVPCHRVIGADGALVGYAGGIARKSWLLQWEQSHHSAEAA